MLDRANLWLVVSLYLVCATAPARPDMAPIIVVNTWPFTCATDAAWEVLHSESSVEGKRHRGTAVNAVVAGCTAAEEDPSIHSVGYGCSPDEQGHTTLDAMVMDGATMEVGAVAAMPDIKQAAQVARDVLLSTRHTLLVGPKAAEFAKSRNFPSCSLDTPESHKLWQDWRAKNCQPNFRRPEAWLPDPSKQCGPYQPNYGSSKVTQQSMPRPSGTVDADKHDTVGVIALDGYGSMAVGLSTSGATYKVPGRVGDSPIPGAGGYVDNEVGGAVGTGDGDVMMRFLLTFQAVQYMRQGLSPEAACRKSLLSVKQKGSWSGGLVALTRDGKYGAACVGFQNFKISVRTDSLGKVTKVFDVPCMQGQQ